MAVSTQDWNTGMEYQKDSIMAVSTQDWNTGMEYQNGF